MRRATHRSRVLSVLVVAGLVGAMLLVGARPSTAWTNECTNEGLPPGGDEIGVDVGPGAVFVGVDLEIAGLLSGNPALGVCVNDDLYGVTTTTVGGPGAGPYVWVNHCTGSTCAPLVDDTGLVGTPAPTTTVGSTIVCAGVCTTVPFAPIKVDTGYDVYVDGTKQADLCVSIGTTC